MGKRRGKQQTISSAWVRLIDRRIAKLNMTNEQVAVAATAALASDKPIHPSTISRLRGGTLKGMSAPALEAIFQAIGLARPDLQLHEQAADLFAEIIKRDREAAGNAVRRVQEVLDDLLAAERNEASAKESRARAKGSAGSGVKK